MEKQLYFVFYEEHAYEKPMYDLVFNDGSIIHVPACDHPLAETDEFYFNYPKVIKEILENYDFEEKDDFNDWYLN